MESKERREMALQYHPTDRGSHGRRLLLGGSATVQSPPWHLRQATGYYGDSDDDSGIGHSNGGQGDRVGSTSSTETEVATEFSSPQLSSANLQKWLSPNASLRPLCSDGQPIGQRLPSTAWLTQQRVPPPAALSSNSEFRPPAMSTPEGSECADDVFQPYKATLIRLPVLPNGQLLSGSSPKGKAKQAQLNQLVRELLPSRPPENHTRTTNGHLQKCPSFKYNLGVDKGERHNKNDGRRVWSYCGDSNYYANVYESVSSDPRKNASKEILQSWANPVAPSSNVVRPKSNCAIPSRDQPVGYLNRETLVNHYDVPLGHNAAWEDNRFQGARSASLSSLITVDSGLLRVHACPASVIPASEVGDSLSESFYVHHNALELNRRYVQPPPPPPPPPMVGPAARARPPSLHGGAYETYASYAVAPPMHSIQQVKKDNGHYKESAVKDNSVPLRTGNEAAYATVTKPKHKVKTGQSPLQNCSLSSLPPSAFLDEIEPPLPPRNYRRDLSSSKHLASSKVSLTDKMQDFSRTAKQALRRAFSLEALNCASESAHNDSDEWDNESDWGRVIHPKPRTPAAVKARDAHRQKLKRSNSTKHTTMATLC